MNKKEKLDEITRKMFEDTVHQNQPDLKVIMPVIRNIMPNIIAQEIVGVQPMTSRPMTVGEMDHACSTWYWVQPGSSPNQVFEFEKSRQYYHDIETWIEDQCGPQGSWHDPDCRWWASNRKYIFKNEEDRTMFVLRWS